jgi:hypothetical protein
MPENVDAGVDDEAMEPGVEAVRIAKAREMPPGSDVAFLDRVACELRVPEDEAGCRVQPHDGRVHELGEGLMIAPLRSLDEKSLVHANLGSMHGIRAQRMASAFGIGFPISLGRARTPRRRPAR